MGETAACKNSSTEMLSHIKETDVSVPFRDGISVLLATEQGRSIRLLPNLARWKAPEEIHLDVNALAERSLPDSIPASQVSGSRPDTAPLLSARVIQKSPSRKERRVRFFDMAEHLLVELFLQAGSLTMTASQ